MLAGPSAYARYQSRCATARPRRSWSSSTCATSGGGHPRSLSRRDYARRSGRRRCRDYSRKQSPPARL